MYNWTRTDITTTGIRAFLTLSGIVKNVDLSGERIERTLTAVRTIGFDALPNATVFLFADGANVMFLDGGIACQP